MTPHESCPLRAREHDRSELRDAIAGTSRVRCTPGLEDSGRIRRRRLERSEGQPSGARSAHARRQAPPVRRRSGLETERWGRSLAGCIRTIQELASVGIRFIALTQNIDTDQNNPASKLLLHLFAAFSEFERELIRERVISGIRAARINGKSLGRPKRLFRRDQAMEMRANGMSWRKIAATLEVPMSTVIDACQNKSTRPTD